MKFMKWAVVVVFVTICTAVLTDARAQNATLYPNADDIQGTDPVNEWLYYGTAVATTDDIAYVSLPGYHIAGSNIKGRIARTFSVRCVSASALP